MLLEVNLDAMLRCSDPHGDFGGLNCLLERHPLADTANIKGIDLARAKGMLAEAREALHAVRTKRPKPHLDDKV